MDCLVFSANDRSLYLGLGLSYGIFETQLIPGIYESFGGCDFISDLVVNHLRFELLAELAYAECLEFDYFR